jgi:hypothetical protein
MQIKQGINIFIRPPRNKYSIEFYRGYFEDIPAKRKEFTV